MERIGQRLKMYREIRKITQTELALRTRLGISSIKKFETGERIPERQTLLKISTVLNVPVTELTGIHKQDKAKEEIDEELLQLLHEVGIERTKFILGNIKELNESQYLQFMKAVCEQKNGAIEYKETSFSENLDLNAVTINKNE